MSFPVRLTVVTGFLGAGKSTWLRHQLRAGVFDGAHVVVNEAAATPVDHEILGPDRTQTVLAGGCACCERRAELVALLWRLTVPSQGDARARHIVLETSGLADPHAIVAAVQGDQDLSARLAVGEVVTLVGAPHGLDVLRAEPLARRQVERADCLIVTRLDQVDDVVAARLAATLALLKPAVPLFGADRGVEVPLPSGVAGAAAIVAELLPAGVEAPLCAVDLAVGDTEWLRVGLWLSALLHARGPDILRVKGVIATPNGRLLLQGVQGALDAPVILPGSPQPGDGTLVVIGRGFEPGDLRRSLRGFARACGP